MFCSTAHQHECNTQQHTRSYIALVQRWEPALGDTLILNKALLMQKTRCCVLSLQELSTLIQLSFNSLLPCSMSQLRWTKSREGSQYLKESASKNSRSSGGHCHNFQVDFSSSRLVPSSKISSRPGSKLTVMVVPSFSSAAS